MCIRDRLRLTWSMANLVAARAGSTRIEPSHFFMAILHVLDDLFHGEAERMGLTGAEIDEIEQLAAEGRERLGVSAEEITRLRRALSRGLSETPQSAPRPHLRRSDRARGLFDLAGDLMQREGGSTLTMVQLVD